MYSGLRRQKLYCSVKGDIVGTHISQWNRKGGFLAQITMATQENLGSFLATLMRTLLSL